MTTQATTELCQCGRRAFLDSTRQSDSETAPHCPRCEMPCGACECEDCTAPAKKTATPRLTEGLELIVRTGRSGADRGGVSFRTRAAAKSYLRAFQTAIGGDETARGRFPGVDFADIQNAWIAGETTGATYFE